LSPRHQTLAKAVHGRYLPAGVVSFSPKKHKDSEKGTHKYAQSIAILQECLYWLDVGDLAKVKRCIEEGLLGTNQKGKPCPTDKIHTKAKTYRESIRMRLILLYQASWQVL
jgi:hypothetical protein